MKTRTLTLTLAALMTLQSPAWAQSPRTEGIGDQQIARAQRELAIIRHDLERLNTALGQTEIALRESKAQGRVWNMAAIGTASAGLGLAALAAATSFAGGKVGTTLITVQTALSAVTGYMHSRENKYAPSDAADRAVQKARQEIMAARASGNDHSASMDVLQKLDQSLAEIQTSLQDYKSDHTVNRRIHLAGMISQTAGTAINLGVGLGFLRISSSYAQILMASGNIATIIHGLTPAKGDLILAEIQQTRTAVQTALAGL